MPRASKSAPTHYAPWVALAVTAVTGVFAFGGFYAVVNSTLSHHDKILSDHTSGLKEVAQLMRGEQEARAKTREEFMLYTQKQSEVMQSILSDLKVSNKVIEQIRETQKERVQIQQQSAPARR